MTTASFQRAVLQTLSSQFIRARHLMSSQRPGKWAGVLASNRIFMRLPWAGLRNA
jgi:hypothetical protein